MADISSHLDLDRTRRVLCGSGAALGLLGLAGWLLGLDVVTTFVAGRPAMMPNTAFALTMADTVGSGSRKAGVKM